MKGLITIGLRYSAALVMAGLGSLPAMSQDALDLRDSLSDGDGVFTESVSSPAPRRSAPSRDASASRPQQVDTSDDTADVPGDTFELRGADDLGDPPDAAVAPRRAVRGIEAEPYAPLGLRAGAFMLFPSLGISGTYSDNVGQVSHAPRDDAGLRLTPALRVESNWVRHRLTFDGSGDLVFYKRQRDFDETTANATANLRLDVRRTTTAEFIADYRLSETSASDSEVPDAAVGRRQDQEFGISGALTHRFNRLSATATVGARALVFDDVELAGGGRENNSDRDYIEPSVALRLGYETSPAIQPFIEAGYRPRVHRRARDRSGQRRNSHGGFLRAGIDLNLSPVWSGNVAARYDVRVFDDRRLDSVHAVGVDANVTWQPTRLTRVVFTAASGIDESASSGVSGSRTYQGSIAVSHNLRENIVIGATGGIDFSDFIGASDEELLLSGGLSASYRIAREIELLASYEIRGFESTQPGSDYIENQISAGFRFRL